MSDELIRRFASRQLELATQELKRDAERLAIAARQYADDAAEGRYGGAYRLAQDATALAIAERRLAGMREIAGLLDGETL